ncbi:MAG: sigE 1 [Ignavibacteria bacterium]|nr:sigE 1 [Ignavibacteria bacterium]
MKIGSENIISLDTHSDIELYHLLRESKEISERAFGELYCRYSPRVYAYCRRFLGDRVEAEDVFQDVFEKFYQSAFSQREMTNVPGFLLKIARNLCLNWKKRFKYSVDFDDNMLVKYDTRNENNELLDLIKMSLDLLSDDLREMFILREYEGLSYIEICDVSGLPMATVKIRIFRAKQKIREILAPYLADLEKN